MVEYIGTAQLQEDGALVLDLRAETGDTVGHGRVIYNPGDEHYQAVLDHIGDIKPGESKPVRPWPDPQ